MKKLLLTLLIVSLFSSLSLSQPPTSDILGNISLEDGSVLSGVSLTLSGENTGRKTTETSKNGKFRFLNLHAGIYELKAELKGFNTLLLKDIKVRADKNLRINLRMRLSDLTEKTEIATRSNCLSVKRTSENYPVLDRKTRTSSVSKSLNGVSILSPPLIRSRTKTKNIETGGGSPLFSLLPKSTSASVFLQPSGSQSHLSSRSSKFRSNSDLPPGQKTERVAANTHYRVGFLQRFLLGTDYRKLWVEPVQAEVLDLQKEAGGLTPAFRVGGHQTMGLAFKGADGRSYTFRGVDKDPSAVLPPFLAGTIAERIVQDQISSAHPAGPLVAEPIMEAAGVLTNQVRLVIMPDDPALGEFQDDFAGVLGTFQEYPTPASDKHSGFAGATKILDYAEIWRRLQSNPKERVDSRAYLRARLVDVFIGDWDRHRQQWRWAMVPGKTLWQPIPEDRDQAFTRYDGLIPGLARFGMPYILNFGKRYSGINGLTFAGWDVDRYLLTDLERSDWEAIASDLKSRLTDSVIEQAVKRLPPEYYRLDGVRLETALKNRRDHLQEIADKYYRHLAHKVDIYMTHMDELAEIVRIDNNTLEISISLRPAEGDLNPPTSYYTRRFHPNETQEIRMHLVGGNDSVISKGGSYKEITIRVIGVPDQYTVDDSQGGGLIVYDPTGAKKITRGPGTRLDKHVYIPPLLNPNAPWIPPREWGHQTIPLLWYSMGPDLGAFLGGGLTTTVYGFRKHPFSSRHSLRAGYATLAQTFRFDYKGEYRLVNSEIFIKLSARASGSEILRFYGYGNETSSAGPDDFYKVIQQQFSINPSITIPFSIPLTLTMGPIFQYSVTEQEPGRFLSIDPPYGTENFGQIGFFAGFRLDRRNRPRASSQGFLISLEGRYFPKLWGVQSSFGSIYGDVSAFLAAPSFPLAPILALRFGGKHVFGEYPFHEAAYIGGGGLTASGSAVRGFRSQRFAGDSALFGNVELRLHLTDIYLFLPGEMGIFGLGDLGRVYFEGENSKKWHTAVGAGIWFSFIRREYSISFAVAKSEERTGFYVQAGFLF